VVLSGGDGAGLRPLLRQLLDTERPKQYVRLLGPRTLLGQTLDRVALGVPASRTVVVTTRQHSAYVAEEWGDAPRPHVLAQPHDRGTAAAVLHAAQWVARRDPQATLAVLPADHFVLGDATFMAHVAETVAWVDRHADRIAVLGAPPSGPIVEYGWLEPGRRLGEMTTGPVNVVTGLWEKPSLSQARTYLTGGYLWNTSVLVGKVATFLSAGQRALPAVAERLACVERFAGTPHEPAALAQAYELSPRATFVRALLRDSTDTLAVSRLPRLVWSDLGSPRRVVEVLTRMRERPLWARSLVPSA
jgi:mannose-1-phosphate guanylyltransferase